jgi:hypothetical protein
MLTCNDDILTANITSGNFGVIRIVATLRTLAGPAESWAVALRPIA